MNNASQDKFQNLKRKRQEMPDFIQKELDRKKLNNAFSARPAYQQNDYLAWIKRAVRPQTRQKRIDQMLSELEKGNVYMKMKWNNPTV